MKLLCYFLSISAQTLFCGWTASASWSQPIVADPTLPIPSQVIPTSNIDFTIQNGTQVGGNLFHSFSQFSVPTHGSVYFNNPVTIQNIITRVTGGVPSSIDGRIEANSTANLFLLNPSGILFGPNAQLNIGGSFLASTASSLKLSDGTEFSAIAPQSPLLTIGVPLGLQYNNSSGAITVQGATLEVQPGTMLALIGGNLTISGSQLSAPNGQLELGGVLDNGSVEWTNDPLQVNFPENLNLADLALTNGTLASTTSDRGGGNINLTGRQINILDSRVESDTFGAGASGDLTVKATDTIAIAGTPGSGRFTNGLFAETLAEGSAGDIRIQTARLIVKHEARVSAATFSSGQGGDLTVNATDFVELIGTDPPTDSLDFKLFTGLLTDTESSGRAGNLTLNTRQLIVRDGAQVSAATFGSGDGGSLTVNATESIELSGVSPSDLLSSGLFVAVQPTASGNAGNLTVNTQWLTIRDGAQIFAGTGGVGNGGELQVNAAQQIEVSGTSPSGFNSALLSSTDDLEVAESGLMTGKAGNLTVNTLRLIVRDGGQVSTSTFGNTQGGGNLSINANQLIEVRGAGADNAIGGRTGILAGTPIDIPGSGNSGNIMIHTNRLTVQDQARVAVNNQGIGDAGSLEIQANSIWLRDRGEITASTASGEGGNIQLQVRDVLLMQRDNLISAEAGGTGNGGNIELQTNFLNALENSDISANAFEGQGGNIQIGATGILGTEFRLEQTLESDITASSQFGVSGAVELRTPEVDPTRGLVVLPVQLVDVTQLIAQGCGTRQNDTASRFVITGRGGLPPNPESALLVNAPLQDIQSVPVPLADARPGSIVAPSNSADPKPLIEAQTLVRTAQGEVFLVAKSTTPSPYSSGLASINCHAR